MDKPITEEPLLDEELQSLVEKAENIYWDNFNGDVWLGRCIFLSFYCSINTCDFCFRSVADKRVQDPKKAVRSLGSILTEAILIKAFDWRIEFLTGGYNIMPAEDILKYVKLVREILDDKIWLNLGTMPKSQLESLQDDVGGIVASLETLEPALHKKTCPDKPIEPYIKMLDNCKELGFKRSITLVIGLGEDRTHWKYVEKFLTDNPMERITVYALRPVLKTPYMKGPTPQEMAWWIAMIRTHFPKIEIIAGTAEYRMLEISLMLRAGANAITKLPATKMFNTERVDIFEEQVKKAKRRWVSRLRCEDTLKAYDWELLIGKLSLTDEEKEEVRKVLFRYLNMMNKKRLINVKRQR